MLIHDIEIIEEFIQKHSTARNSMTRWIDITKTAKWGNLVDIRQQFNSTDVVNNKYVFDIGGNKYRLVTRINFETGEVTVLLALTHKEYDEITL